MFERGPEIAEPATPESLRFEQTVEPADRFDVPVIAGVGSLVIAVAPPVIVTAGGSEKNSLLSREMAPVSERARPLNTVPAPTATRIPIRWPRCRPA